MNNIYNSHQFSQDNLLLPSFAIEGFIIQGTAFLDFYMLYLCSIFRIKETKNLSGYPFSWVKCEYLKTFMDWSRLMQDTVQPENQLPNMVPDNLEAH